MLFQLRCCIISLVHLVSHLTSPHLIAPHLASHIAFYLASPLASRLLFYLPLPSPTKPDSASHLHDAAHLPSPLALGFASLLRSYHSCKFSRVDGSISLYVCVCVCVSVCVSGFVCVCV